MAERVLLARSEGREKVTGTRVYADDLVLPGMLHGVTVRSRLPHARLDRIEYLPGVPWHEFTIVTAKDIPDANNYIALIVRDQPSLAGSIIKHAEEAVVLLAHQDASMAAKARSLVRLHCTPLTPCLSIEQAASAKEVIWGQDNVQKSIAIDKGQVDQTFAADSLIVEGVYATGAQEQLYIEPHVVIASYEPQTGVYIQGSMQCPFYVKNAVMALLGLPADQVRIRQTETGGGFGGKEDYPSIIAGHAALLARKSGRPVKMLYDRSEDMACTTKRHPSLTKHRTVIGPDGKIHAMDISYDIDGGAYATLSPVVLSRGAIHAAGPYAVENVRIRARALATNHPPNGAFRGFGAPQSIFALERHMDRLAKVLGMSPAELRRRNFLRQGQTTATGQIIHEAIDLEKLLDRALHISDYDAKRRAFDESNRHAKMLRGIGLSTFMHGAGFTGSGEIKLASRAAIEVDAQGVVHVLASSTEMGQGTNTVFTQIVMETLGLPPTQILVARPDTHEVPDSGPTVASRTVMVVGKLIENACQDLKKILVDGGYTTSPLSPEGFAEAARQYIARNGRLRIERQYQVPAGMNWDDQNYRGDAYATFAWAVYVAEVEVDKATLQATVSDFYAVQEVGRVMHPLLARGQIEGGVVQGVGFALSEEVVWREGRMANARMTNYIIPTAMDVPRIVVEFVEGGGPHGPSGGAKGIGELPMDGPAPAIASALEHALGFPVDQVPATPEVLWRLRAQGQSVVS